MFDEWVVVLRLAGVVSESSLHRGLARNGHLWVYVWVN